jgi:hypothetical protein
MMSESTTIDFSLPNNAESIKFIKLTQADKLKAVTLGMKFLSLGNQQLQMWNNTQWEDRIKSLKIQQQQTINELQANLNESDLKFHKLIQSHKEEINNIVESVQNRTESKFLSEIANLNDNVERMDNKIKFHENHKRDLYKTINEEFYNKLLSKEQCWEEKLEKLREQYETKLDKERDRAAACILTTQHSTIKGQAGEKITLQELNRRFPQAEIEDTHKLTGRGDFIMKENGFIMLIETKNYTKNVTKPEIDKFYRDMKTNSDVQCGLFVSLKSGICNREDLHLEVIDEKPIIFIHNALENIENIDLAIRIFKLILKTDSIDLSSKEVYEKIKNTIPIIKRFWNKMRQKLQKFEKDMSECISEQEIMLRDIFKLLSFNY